MRRRISQPAPYSPALRRLGGATPPPFVGRTQELAALAEALRTSAVVVVHGAVGSGKTRLAMAAAVNAEIAGTLPSCYVSCSPGDRGAALLARAERALGALPGSLDEVLHEEARLLIIDDAHSLHPEEAARTFHAMMRSPGAGRLLLLSRDVLPLRRKGVPRVEIDLEGLDAAAARELWAHLEDTYGPTQAEACDDALARTRGMPLALRREYACSAVGEDAWNVEALSDDSRRALEAIAVARVPVGPAAVAAMAQGIDAEPTLIDLVSRQLVDPLEDGRFDMHDVVRDSVLATIDGERRRACERTAADLIASLAGEGAQRPAWEAGDDGAFGLGDPIDRTREAVHHLLEAGDAEAATDRLIADRTVALRRGGGGEIVALVERIEQAIGGNVPRLAALRAEIAARQGRVSEAIVHAAIEDPVAAAELSYFAGDVLDATTALEELRGHASADIRCRAAALLAEIELDRGSAERAQSLAHTAFERDRQAVGEEARARLHAALGAIEERAGRFTSARAALSRAASSGRLDPVLSAQIEARRAICLAEEGRLSEAERVLGAADALARELDAVAVADEIRRCRALVRALAGDLARACHELRDLVDRRRERGDEIRALRAEIDLARLLERRGELSAASELASACSQSAARRTLDGLAARADLVSAAIDLAEFRIDEARQRLAYLADSSSADQVVRAEAAGLLAQAEACAGRAGRGATLPDAGDSCRGRVQAALVLAAGDPTAALEMARDHAVRAERAGRTADMAEALSVVARLQAARGERGAAHAAATRAARGAKSCGLTRSRADALLVLASLAREDGDVTVASSYARDAAELAASAGLPVERLVAAKAMEVIAGDRAEGAEQLHSAAAATMSEAAMRAAEQMLADIGLTAARPYRVVGPAGEESFIADASPELLRLEERDLAVDGVREVIVRHGNQVADLRRRSLLKRLLFLFAAAPGKTFSKEEIVESVWEVDYHPLRHDAALFTNIMRIRRLLGKDGADLIRVSEDGYRFCPPKDFLFVEAVADKS